MIFAKVHMLSITATRILHDYFLQVAYSVELSNLMSALDSVSQLSSVSER